MSAPIRVPGDGAGARIRGCYVMRDNSGNWLVLVERNDVSPEEMNGAQLG